MPFLMVSEQKNFLFSLPLLPQIVKLHVASIANSIAPSPTIAGIVRSPHPVTGLKIRYC